MEKDQRLFLGLLKRRLELLLWVLHLESLDLSRSSLAVLFSSRIDDNFSVIPKYSWITFSSRCPRFS